MQQKRRRRNSSSSYRSVIIPSNSQFAAIQVDGNSQGIHDAALAWPGIICIIVHRPKDGGVRLPIHWTVYTTTFILGLGVEGGEKCDRHQI